MPSRSEIQAFLTSIGHEAASNDQPSLCLTEAVVEALGEVTEGMEDDGAEAFEFAKSAAKAARRARNDEHEAAGRGRPAAEDVTFPVDWLRAVYVEMFAARLRGEKG